MSKCGYEWSAPFIPAPTAPRDYRPVRPKQVCALPENHDGDHRSAGKVTAPNRHRFRPAMDGSVCGHRTARGYGHSAPCWRPAEHPIHDATADALEKKG